MQYSIIVFSIRKRLITSIFSDKMRTIIKNVTSPSATPYYVDGILFIDNVFFYLTIRKDSREFDESECSKGKEKAFDVPGWRWNQRTRSHYGSLT